jgi:PIN domain nuclease of toxin-antitoxin system
LNLLLDTHAVVWELLSTTHLSISARDAIVAPNTQVMVSVAPIWEIAIKVGLGKWPEAAPLLAEIEARLAGVSFTILPISIAHVRTVGLMTSTHRDPLDRLLAAQASVEALTMVTMTIKSRNSACQCSGEPRAEVGWAFEPYATVPRN